MSRGREAIRAQSTIWYKFPTPFLLLTITAFSVRMLLIRTENAVGARERASALVACDGI